MSLVCSPNLENELTDVNLFVDTCTIIDASKCNEVKEFLQSINNEHNCTLFSPIEVKDEFLCSANSVKEYQELITFAKVLGIAFTDELKRGKIPGDDMIFNIALSRCKSINPSYIDRLLLYILYFYHNSPEKALLITSNHKDIPKEFFDRIGFIAYDAGDLHSIGVYQFNEPNFREMTQDLLNSKSQGK